MWAEVEEVIAKFDNVQKEEFFIKRYYELSEIDIEKLRRYYNMKDWYIINEICERQGVKI